MAAALWFVACLLVLLLTLPGLDAHTDTRSALARLLAVYFLGFPSTHLAFVVVSKLKLALYLGSGFEPSLLSECLFTWTLMVVLGYAQWFIALPWLSRLCRRCCMANDKSRRTGSPGHNS